jgi:hypothetical protein
MSAELKPLCIVMSSTCTALIALLDNSSGLACVDVQAMNGSTHVRPLVPVVVDMRVSIVSPSELALPLPRL